MDQLFFFSLLVATLIFSAVFLLWPLIFKRGDYFLSDQVNSVYVSRKQNLLDLHESGGISSSEYDGAIAEEGRFFSKYNLANNDKKSKTGISKIERLAIGLIVATLIGAISISLYVKLGDRYLPDFPLDSREKLVKENNIDNVVLKMEAYLSKHPEDGKGFELIAPVYLQKGEFERAVASYKRALDLLGETPSRLTNYAESILIRDRGVINDETKGLLLKSVEIDHSFAKARFYLAIYREQSGDKDGALIDLRNLMNELPDGDAKERVRQEILRFEQEMSPSEKNISADKMPQAIIGMVESLDARLSKKSGSYEEWGRLVRARIVLGQKKKAEDAMQRAKIALADFPERESFFLSFEKEISLLPEDKNQENKNNE